MKYLVKYSAILFFTLGFSYSPHLQAQSIINCIEVYSVDQIDPNSTPNNGVATEDDYACSIICKGGRVITNVVEVYSTDQIDPNSTPGNGVATEDDIADVYIILCNAIICNLSATSTTTPPTCPNNDGTINLTVTGATGTPTYKWSNGATTQNLTGLPAGDYTVTVTDGACTATAMVSLNKPNTNIPYAICPGDSYKLEIQDNTLTGIQWLKDGVAISGANGLTYTATQIGVYTYTSNGVGGCAVGQCCPIEITASTNCCKPVICTSVKITKN